VAEVLLLPNLGLNIFFTLAFLLLATQGRPGLVQGGLIVLAFLGARNAGHAFNQWADRQLDAANPRTKGRPLVEGRLSSRAVLLLVAGNLALFLVAAALLRPTLVLLALPAVALVLGYSYTKRITAWTTVVLGAVEALVPAGVFLAVDGTLPLVAWPGIAALVAFGTAFEIVHSLQDVEADRRLGLRSIPVAVGVRRAILLQGTSLALALFLLALLGAWTVGPSVPYAAGILALATLAFLEVRGLGTGRWPLPTAFRSHFLMGACFLVGVLATYTLPGARG
jgi:4-hydroxybenzoate polyprenyltransferase